MSAGKAELLAGPGRTRWIRDVTPAAWRVLGLSGLGWMFDVYDNFMLALTIPALVTAFALSKATAGAIGSILAAGLVLGEIGFGWVADRIGRVRTLMPSARSRYTPATCPTTDARSRPTCCTMPIISRPTMR